MRACSYIIDGLESCGAISHATVNEPCPGILDLELLRGEGAIRDWLLRDLIFVMVSPKCYWEDVRLIRHDVWV